MHQHRGLLFPFHQVFRRAEVQQQDLPVLTDHQVVRADVTVHDPFFMHPLQIVDHRQQKPQALLCVHDCASYNEVFFERYSVDILHHDIGRIVFIEHVPHAHYGIQASHSGGFLCFLDESLAAFFQGRPCAAGAPAHLGAAALSAHRSSCREVLFDAHGRPQCLVIADIGEAESSLAEHPADHIPLAQDRPAGQCLIGLDIQAVVKPARGAYFGLPYKFIHAVIAASGWHGSSP